MDARRRLVFVVSAFCAAGLCLPHSSAQQGQSFPGFVKSTKDGPVAHTNVGIHTFGGVATSGEGDFEIRDSQSKLVIGDYYTLYVEGWVILDPYIHEPGGMYLPNPAHNKLAIKVIKKGSPELLSDISISNIVLEKVAVLKPELKAGKAAGTPVSLIKDQNLILDGRTFESRSTNAPEHIYRTTGRTSMRLRLVNAQSDFFKNDTFLHQKAKDIGFSAEVLATAVRDWSNRATDPYQKGVAVLYAGRYAEAQDYLRRSVAGDSKPDNAYLALASAEYELANYSAAEDIYRQLLDRHPNDPFVLNNLAAVLMKAGKLADVEDLLKRALLANERLGESKELHDSYVFNNLGNFYAQRSDYRRSEANLKQALELKLRIIGPQDPDTATTMNNLALVYGDEGRFKEAEQLQKDALANKEAVLGPNNASVASSLHNLGLLYTNTGRYSEAESLLRREMAIVDRLFGKQNPQTAASFHTLADLYMLEARYSEAEPLLTDALAIDQKVFGSGSLRVAEDSETLGILYYHQTKLSKAEAMLQDALPIYEKLFSPENPQVANLLNNLGIVYRAEKKYVDAEAAYSRSLRIYEKTLGREHQDTALTLNSMGNLYVGQSRFGEAEPILKRALDIRQRVYGPDHPLIASTLHSLGNLYYLQAQYISAESYYRQSLVMQEKFGLHHPRVALFAKDLALVLRRLNREDEARAVEERYSLVEK